MTETRSPTTPDRGKAVEKKKLPERIALFYRQVIAELRKVIYPTRKELITYTSVVIVFVCVVIAYVTALDFAFSQGILAIFG